MNKLKKIKQWQVSARLFPFIELIHCFAENIYFVRFIQIKQNA